MMKRSNERNFETMKAIHKIMWRIGAGCGAALLAVGCTTSKIHLEVAYEQLQFSAQDNIARYVDVAADGDWSCEVAPAEAASWLTVTNDNNEVLVVEATGDNWSLEPRQAQIRLRDAGNDVLLKTIAVTQEACPAWMVPITVSEERLLFGPGAKDALVKVDVMDGVDWTVEMDGGQEWMTAVRAEDGVLVRVTGNDAEQMRYGTIMISAPDVDATPCFVSVYQFADVKDQLSLEFDGGDKMVTVGPEKGEKIDFRVNSSFTGGFYDVYTATAPNVTREEAVPVSWLQLDVNFGGPYWKMWTTEANRSGKVRKGYVILYCSYEVDGRKATLIYNALVQQAAAEQ